MSLDVSVVICIRNSISSIENCLLSVLDQGPGEIIFIDGGSTDGSLDVASRYEVPVYFDHGRGIAKARDLGINKSKKPYILFVGPDNILPKNFIRDMVNAMNRQDFVAAAPQTRVLDPKTFWDIGLDFRLLAMENKVGQRSVIGTPTLYKRKIFEKIKYNEHAGACDDTDIGLQMKRNDFLFGVVPVLVYDQNNLSGLDIWKKFKLYGSGDCAFYRLHSIKWTFCRKLLSLTHPLRQTIWLSVLCFIKCRPHLTIWLFIAMISRYQGWYWASKKRM